MHDNDDLPHIDSEPHDIDIYRVQKHAERGEVERGGIVFDREHDYFTRTALMAQVKELYGLLRELTDERDGLLVIASDLSGACKITAEWGQKAVDECLRLRNENETLKARLGV